MVSFLVWEVSFLFDVFIISQSRQNVKLRFGEVFNDGGENIEQSAYAIRNQPGTNSTGDFAHSPKYEYESANDLEQIEIEFHSNTFLVDEVFLPLLCIHYSTFALECQVKIVFLGEFGDTRASP